MREVDVGSQSADTIKLSFSSCSRRARSALALAARHVQASHSQPLGRRRNKSGMLAPVGNFGHDNSSPVCEELSRFNLTIPNVGPICAVNEAQEDGAYEVDLLDLSRFRWVSYLSGAVPRGPADERWCG